MSHVKSINIEALTSAKSEMTKILNTRALNVADVSRVMSLAFGGTDAAGAWYWRMGFDVMQAAALATARAHLGSTITAQAGLLIVEDIAASLPTETRRTERQMQLQQFTTAMPWGWIVAQAADPQAGDVVLEPSAGTGCLAALAEAAGSQTARSTPELILNEIDPTRAALLAQLTGKTVTAHDAEFIDDLLARELAPTLVVMNPPFASSVARSSDSTIAMRHVLSAAKRLCEGGRLVAIVPPGVSAERGGALWARLCEEVTPVLRLTLPRSAFARMGASVETHLLIADKPTAKTEPLARTREARFVVGSPSEALDLLSSHLPARQPLAKPVALSNRLKASAPKPRPSAQDAISAARPKMLLPASGSLAARAHSSTAMVPLDVTVFNIARSNEALSDVYARYAPQRISIKGAKAHPTVLVESLAMASVAAPAPSEGACELSLPERLVGEGLLSEAQLETVIMAETAFGHDLPGRFSVTEKNLLQRADEDAQAHTFRKGYFLGDGTGCGKGRQVAGLILAGWGAGRRKALWVSRSATLVEDAIRDWCDLGGARTDIHALSKWSGDDDLKLREGILFTTYATLRAVAQSGKTRLDQVLSWLGEDFDGLIAFDEAHAMQNAGGSSSARGAAAPSQQGLAGLRLQNALPRARVLYVSATGATEVSNLAYASRLGLWGAGLDYPFPSREGFVEAMEAGGVAAMEVVARDLKALGLYTARALSFDGVEYDILEHALSEDQIGVYDAWAGAFKTIHNNLNAALEATGISARDDGSAEAGSGSAKAAAISAFESTKQRFFGHLLQGMKAKSVIAAIEADVADGWAPVVQIVSTGEALLKRRLETLAPDEELAEASLTPRDYVLGYLQNAFPVMQMQLVEQEDGSVIAEPFRDENGNPVVSREAERLRDELMEDLLLLAPVPSALDQLVWAFGPERIAEVTGRSVRPIKQSDGSLKVERRAASANSAETQAFMGVRRIY